MKEMVIGEPHETSKEALYIRLLQGRQQEEMNLRGRLNTRKFKKEKTWNFKQFIKCQLVN